MSQKSILSFFKSPKSNGVVKEATVNGSKNPAKAVKIAEQKEDSPKKSLIESLSPKKSELKASPVKEGTDSVKEVKNLPLRKTARKAINSGKIAKSSAAKENKVESPISKEIVANGKKNGIAPEKTETEKEPCSMDVDSPSPKQMKKRKNRSASEGSDEEIPQVSKKSRKNVIADDSPVKTTKKSAGKKVLSDDDDVAADVEEMDVQQKTTPKGKKQSGKGKKNAKISGEDENKDDVLQTPAKGKKDTKKSPKGRKSNAKSPKEKKSAKGSTNKDETKETLNENNQVEEMQQEPAPKSQAIHSFFKPTASSKDSQLPEGTGKSKDHLKSESDGSEDEINQAPKRNRKNVILGDSPVKATKKSASKKVLSDEENDVAVDEEPVSKKKIQSGKGRNNSEKSDGEENLNDAVKAEDSRKTPVKGKKGAKTSAKGKRVTRKSPKGKKGAKASASNDEKQDSAESNPDEEKEQEQSPKSSAKDEDENQNDAGEAEENSGSSKTPMKGKKGAKKSPKGRGVTKKSPKEKKKAKVSESNDEKEDSAESNPDEEKEPEPSPKSSAIHSFFTKKTDKESGQETKVVGKSEKVTKGNSGYDPSKSHYHPIDNACWKKGEKVPYLALARTFDEIEAISARLKMIEILANYFRSVIVLSPDDLLQSVYLCLNRIAPEYEGIELGVGETLVMKAVAQATGRSFDKIKAEVATKGDLGLVAESSRGNQRVMFAFPKLTVSSVFAKFKEIAQMSGNAVVSKKTDKMQALFSACRECEARFIVRSLSGKLRIGLAEQSVLAALAQATFLTPPNQDYPPDIINASSSISAETYKKKLEAQALILKTTYCECPNYDLIIPVLLKEGITELPKHCQLKAGIPLKPMLAHPTKGIDEVLQRFDTNEFTCEFKYDGERAQIHLCESGDIKIYSRNQEDNTTKYPDVITYIRKAFKDDVKSFILDSEVVAWDKENGEILPFQVLSTRKKKDVADNEIKVQVCIMAFDLLYVNGASLVKETLRERRSLMKKHFVEVTGEIAFAHSMDGNSADVMQEFLDESIKGKCEGLMVKSLDVDASYEIAKRSHNWLKLKKDYLEGVGDTLDLVVIGGWYGKGKRAGYFGGFLLACYDDETEEFQTICKLGTGFKDEDLDTFGKYFKDHIIPSAKSYIRYDGSLEPDAWFDPVQVWEIKCADLSISPIHKAAAGIVDPEKGISLRFPRFMRVRDDKKPEDSTTASQVAKMYNSQSQIQNQKKSNKTEDEDFY